MATQKFGCSRASRHVLAKSNQYRVTCNAIAPCRRKASSASAISDALELEPSRAAESSHNDFDPLAQSRGRTRQLPASRYKFRSPKYYRGPLHPHQPLKPSDPNSREFVPGPFTLPRLSQTYSSTIASDIMTLAYQHYPPGYVAPIKAPPLRQWDDSSPYHKGRPLRPPRGSFVRSIQKPVTFRNIPTLTGITVHSFVKQATEQPGALHVAGMAIQTITGVKYSPRVARHSVQSFHIRAGKPTAVVCNLEGEIMWHFLAKTIDIVMPKIKDWRGVKGSSGDSRGNITFGMSPEEVSYFPEIEVNYDSYPQHFIPGCHITMKTSARQDREARLLLTALGVPFYGEQVN